MPCTKQIMHRSFLFASFSAAMFSFAATAQAFDSSMANEASWRYVLDAIGNCTDYTTSIPKIRDDEPLIQIRVTHVLIQDKCKFTLAIANKVTSCFVTLEQRQEIQKDGKKVIGRLLDDESTCGVKAEQALLATIPEPVDIPRIAPKEVEVAPAPEKPISLRERIRTALFGTDDMLSASDKK